MDGTVLWDLGEVIGISLLPVAIFSAALHARSLAEKGVSFGRRVRLLRAPDTPPDGPPLEELAADLRRLRPEVRSPRPGVAMARQRGVVAAYDGILISTAVALDVPTTLGELHGGLDLEAERLRLEHALELAGLDWQVHDR
jgi:hypothetical protein